MPTTTNLSTLKINYLTQAQYDAAVSNNTINENEIYLTPSPTTLAGYGITDAVNKTGDTMTGGLTISSNSGLTVSGSNNPVISLINTNQTYNTLQMSTGNSGNHGLWSLGYGSTDDSRWVIYRSGSDGKIYIPYNNSGNIVWSDKGRRVWVQNDTTVPSGATAGDIVLSTGGYPAFNLLWEGFFGNSALWTSGSITVPNLSNYHLYMVRFQNASDGTNQGTYALVIRDINGGYFRGSGAYCSSNTRDCTYIISATISGNTLTMDACHCTIISGTTITRLDMGVCQIYGVL